jgi:predicted acyl esterase
VWVAAALRTVSLTIRRRRRGAREGQPLAPAELKIENDRIDVDPDGRSRNVSDGYLRIGPKRSSPVRIDLDPVAHRFRPGHGSG